MVHISTTRSPQSNERKDNLSSRRSREQRIKVFRPRRNSLIDIDKRKGLELKRHLRSKINSMRNISPSSESPIQASLIQKSLLDASRLSLAYSSIRSNIASLLRRDMRPKIVYS